jgi:hypothetical protein
MRWVVCLGTGAVVGSVGALVAVIAMGGGHGSYVPTAILFPYTMALATMVGHITPVLMGLALIQFPAYGAVVAFTKASARIWWSLLGLHAGAAAIAYMLITGSRTWG